MARSKRVSAVAVEKQLVAFLALLEERLPPKQVPAITSPEEARAVSEYLLASAHGTADAFAQEGPFLWNMVQRVLGRYPETMGDTPRVDVAPRHGGDHVSSRSVDPAAGSAGGF